MKDVRSGGAERLAVVAVCEAASESIPRGGVFYLVRSSWTGGLVPIRRQDRNASCRSIQRQTQQALVRTVSCGSVKEV